MTYAGWYRTLRNHNHFGVVSSLRYAWWMSHPKPIEPGEFWAWLDNEIDRHPKALGITLGAIIFAVAVWVHWTVTR